MTSGDLKGGAATKSSSICQRYMETPQLVDYSRDDNIEGRDISQEGLV
jgi:hypothetical protein